MNAGQKKRQKRFLRNSGNQEKKKPMLSVPGFLGSLAALLLV
jgi:hypothetical protein